MRPSQSQSLSTYQCLAELGPLLAGERNFDEVARSMLDAILTAVGAREGALFAFRSKPGQLSAAAWKGYALFPDSGFVPLNSRQIHALETASAPFALSRKESEKFLSSGGNVPPDLFRCIVPLRVGAKLAGIIGLGARREDSGGSKEPGSLYSPEEMQALSAFSHYVALAVHNHNLKQSLHEGVLEHLRLLDSVHKFCDQAMEVFASAIDAKEYRSNRHSLRVGRYAAAIGSALGLNSNEVAELRAAGYLHDIGKVAVDKHLFLKAAPLDPQEFREVADHTLVGHRIVAGIRFPWPGIADVVRWHHERSDGSGYPDHLRHHEIPQVARIIAVTDSMTSERPYRKSLELGAALKEIVDHSPRRLDSDVVHCLLMMVQGEVSGDGPRFLDPQVACNLSSAEVDRLTANLKLASTSGRSYSIA